MNPMVGNRIFTKIQRAPKELIAGFKGFPSSNIGDMMSRLYCMNAGIRPFNDVALLGSAFTVKAPMGDNAMLHYALDLAEPGDVIVVDGAGAVDRSLCGEIMFTYAMSRGIAGFIIDGAIRDCDAARKLAFPVYAKAVCPQGPYKNGLGEINVPVCCGNQVVLPGDILVGDADGVVVIRKEDAPAILEMVQKKFAYEEQLLGNYHNGVFDHEEHFALYDKVAKANGTILHN